VLHSLEHAGLNLTQHQYRLSSQRLVEIIMFARGNVIRDSTWPGVNKSERNMLYGDKNVTLKYNSKINSVFESVVYKRQQRWKCAALKLRRIRVCACWCVFLYAWLFGRLECS